MMQSMAHSLTWEFWTYYKYSDEQVDPSLTSLGMELSSHHMTN